MLFFLILGLLHMHLRVLRFCLSFVASLKDLLCNIRRTLAAPPHSSLAFVFVLKMFLQVVLAPLFCIFELLLTKGTLEFLGHNLFLAAVATDVVFMPMVVVLELLLADGTQESFWFFNCFFLLLRVLLQIVLV